MLRVYKLASFPGSLQTRDRKVGGGPVSKTMILYIQTVLGSVSVYVGRRAYKHGERVRRLNVLGKYFSFLSEC